ncbi:hypothetical protein BX070DRAFT_152953 [Coemansia spiralis]|nr:hypothetical protein BX070DRAFT_152953 [Coemansia spiralis]
MLFYTNAYSSGYRLHPRLFCACHELLPRKYDKSVSGSTTFISDSKALIAWQEPFLYEAKVYASTRERIPSNATRFFESAELLWASGPQSLANRKPYLCGKATVSLPESLMIITDSVHRGVYAHVFIQKTNSQLKHPDMNDPHIVHSVEPLVWWEPPAKMDDESSSSNSAYLSYRNTDKSNFNYQLVASKSVSWAIVMDESIFLVYSALNLDIDKQPPARASHLLEPRPSIQLFLETRSLGTDQELMFFCATGTMESCHYPQMLILSCKASNPT